MERKKIKANDGMILTDGNVFGTEIYLGDGANENDFKEIPYEEFLELTKQEEELYE